jgi:hypothetical protein
MTLMKEKQISVMDWPGNLPDLNPIENLWAIMKARLKRVPKITSLPLLDKAIKMMWAKDLPIWPTSCPGGSRCAFRKICPSTSQNSFLLPNCYPKPFPVQYAP